MQSLIAGRRACVALLCVFVAVLIPSIASGDGGELIDTLVPNTAVLLDASTSGGSGGTSTVASSNTTIFTPSAFADYKRFGGEPSVTVDRYPFPGTNASTEAQCAGGASSCFKDITYESAPQGVVQPHYSQFYKSTDLAASFRKTQQVPGYGLELANAGGGGDSHQAVGEITHDVYFIDLTLAPGITMNVSDNLGESWRTDPFGEGLNFLDDRQWVDADEKAPDGGRVYVSTINLLNPAISTLVTIINTTGWPTGGENAHSTCNPATYNVRGTPVTPPTEPAADSAATPCPDPADPYLWVAGPVVADKWASSPHYHDVYVPFIRRIATLGLGDVFAITGWQIYIAKSHDGGATWTRHKVADLPATVQPSNIFPEMTIDKGGNLYYTWSQAQNAATTSHQKVHDEPGESSDTAGEQDIYYTYSQRGGSAGTWASPINLTKESGDSAIFPWMVAGDPGQVDLVYYKSNSGINSNIQPPSSTWNVYFAQSQNALNTGADFKSVQVSAQPNHVGLICTGGLGCDEDRDLLDFFTVDIDHLGAAVIAYSDDHEARNSDTRDKVTRQISGNSVFKNVSLSPLQQNWPIRDHGVLDPAADVFDTAGFPKGACPGMDVTKLNVDRANGQIRVTLTLNGAPTAATASTCGGVASSGGLWGAEFWAPSSTFGGADGSNTFYIAYRDDANGKAVEGGVMDRLNFAVTSLEFHPLVPGTLGGTCLPTVGPPATGTCTISMTVSSGLLGIPSGGALNNTTGLSVYSFGVNQPVPGTRVVPSNSELADATAALYVSGTGTP
ncbi:MAG: hypothetical protein ACJ734_02995 [Gaiellaceae bacterium]